VVLPDPYRRVLGFALLTSIIYLSVSVTSPCTHGELWASPTPRTNTAVTLRIVFAASYVPLFTSAHTKCPVSCMENIETYTVTYLQEADHPCFSSSNAPRAVACVCVFSLTFSWSRKPFYKQLYKGLKEIDTFKIANNITASIMY